MKESKIIRLKEKMTSLHKTIELKKEALRQHEAFCQWLLKNKKVDVDEMKPFFKRKKDVSKLLKRR